MRRGEAEREVGKDGRTEERMVRRRTQGRGGSAMKEDGGEGFQNEGPEKRGKCHEGGLRGGISE